VGLGLGLGLGVHSGAEGPTLGCGGWPSGCCSAVAVRSAGWDCGAEEWEWEWEWEWMWIGINRLSRLGAARAATGRAAR
jgi:hypothetical protein